MVKIVPIYRRTEPPRPPAPPTLARTPFGSFYRCDFCPYRTRLRTGITDHLSHHNTRTFRDLFSCDRRIGDTYQCPACEIRSPLKFLLVEHVKLRHLELNIAPTFLKITKCGTAGCGFKSHSKIILQEHGLRKLGCAKSGSVAPNKPVLVIVKPRLIKNRDPLAFRARTIRKEGRVREKVTKLRPILPKRRTLPKPQVILLAQSIVFQCRECLCSAINQPDLIKQHVTDQHYKGPNDALMYQYGIFRIGHKLTVMIDVQRWPLHGKSRNYFQCRKCPFRTEIWNSMKIHFHLNVGHKEFCEFVDRNRICL